MSDVKIPNDVFLRIVKLTFESNREKMEPYSNFDVIPEEFKEFYIGFAKDLIVEYEAWKKEQGK